MIPEDHPEKMFQTLKPFVLASASPRRKMLLQSVGLRFDVIPSEIEESNGPEETPETLVQRWAQEKAQAVERISPHHWILAADTIVVLEGTIFGKPAHPDEAVSMLKRLSGRTHEVISGICLLPPDGGHNIQLRWVGTQVHFKPLTDAEIRAYVRTGEPLDKAGAYGIQGIGAFLVQWIHGSYTNVVGLPLCETLEWLLQQEVIAPVQS